MRIFLPFSFKKDLHRRCIHSNGKRMAALQSRLREVQHLVGCGYESFDKAVDSLGMKGLVDLISELQRVMSDEQSRFDLLSARLKETTNPVDRRRITLALYNCQMRLATLYNRSMRCFTQQDVQVKKEQWKSTKSSLVVNSKTRKSPIVTIQKMPSPSVISSEECSPRVFRESLRFFKSQEDKLRSCNHCFAASAHGTKNTIFKNSRQFHKNDTIRNSNMSISVESILSNVKTISVTQNNGFPNIIPKERKYSEISDANLQLSLKITPIVSQSKNTLHTGSSADTRIFANDSCGRRGRTLCTEQDAEAQGTLSSRFNPKFEPELDEVPSPLAETMSKSETYRSTRNYTITNTFDSTEFSRRLVNTPTLNLQKPPSQDNSSVPSSTPSPPRLFDRCFEISLSDCRNSNNVYAHSIKDCSLHHVQRDSLTFKGHCDNSDDASHSELGSSEASEENVPVFSSLEPDCYDTGVESSCFDRSYDSFESDYDPKDFVVHKTSFPDDYVEVMSEDAYSSINEDYDVEHPDDLEAESPDMPSPDYLSDEEEEFLVHQGRFDYVQENEPESLSGSNPSQYIADPRRYLYYPEDKELEVIYEVDEEDLEEQSSSAEPSDFGGSDGS